MALYNDIIPKGTVIVGDGTTRGGVAVTIGADNTVLQADSGQSGGIGWTASPTLTPTNTGTANTGVTATEEGDDYTHRTTLVVSQTDALTTADNAAICDGYLLYTFPAGVIVVDNAYMTMAVTSASSEQQSDAPDVGLGTVIGSGAVATLDGTATFEDILTGQTATDSNGTATVAVGRTTVAGGLPVAAGAAHTVHFNVADTWADDTGADLTMDIAGTVVLTWRFLA